MPCAEQELKFEYLFDYKSVNAGPGQSVEEVTAMAQCETEVEEGDRERQRERGRGGEADWRPATCVAEDFKPLVMRTVEFMHNTKGAQRMRMWMWI